MPKGRRTRVWNALAVVTVLGAVASLADRASFGGLIIIGPSSALPTPTAVARNRTALRRARAASVSSTNSSNSGVCQCNPGFAALLLSARRLLRASPPSS